MANFRISKDGSISHNTPDMGDEGYAAQEIKGCSISIFRCWEVESWEDCG